MGHSNRRDSTHSDSICVDQIIKDLGKKLQSLFKQTLEFLNTKNDRTLEDLNDQINKEIDLLFKQYVNTTNSNDILEIKKIKRKIKKEVEEIIQRGSSRSIFHRRKSIEKELEQVLVRVKDNLTSLYRKQ